MNSLVFAVFWVLECNMTLALSLSLSLTLSLSLHNTFVYIYIYVLCICIYRFGCVYDARAFTHESIRTGYPPCSDLFLFLNRGWFFV